MKKEDPSKNNQGTARNATDSLDQSLDRLRDLYINFKDLSQRCVVDINPHNKSDKRIFYFKPDCVMLDDPEKQRQYRDKLLRKITAMPTPEPIHFMGDDLHKAILESIQDRSQPTVCKTHLANFYKRRQYQIQHKKYKLLLRWAHHAIATENVERVGYEATQKYAKWEYDMENAIKRFERLDFEDGFDTAKPANRPNTKAKEGGSLYVENSDLEPMSIIRQDDIEVYLRTVTYDQRINRLISKFLARMKWLPLYRRYDIWTDAVESFNRIREANIAKQEIQLEKIKQKGEAIIPADHEEQLQEFQDIIKHYFIYNYNNKVVNKSDKIIHTQKSDHQLAPTMISNILELKVTIVDKALEYGIYGDIELDQGYSFAYQITIFFPTYFQKQIIQSQFSLYDAFAGEEQDLNQVQKRNLQNMVKIDTNIFKDISTTKNNVPSQEYLNTDPSFQDIKVTRLKTCSYWIDYVCVFPKVPLHSQKQAALLSSNNPIDSLLKSAMNFLDVNDLATVNKILEETARLHQQQQKELAVEAKARAKRGLPTKDEEREGKPSLNEGPQNIRAHFQSAIRGEIGGATDTATQVQKGAPQLSNLSLQYMPQHLITAFYILRHMKSRDYKIKLLYCLNYFRSVQKRMMLDLREFGTRERIYGDQVQPYIAPTEASRAAQRNVATNFTKNQKEQQKMASISERINKSQMENTSTNNEASASDRQASILKQAEISDHQEKVFTTINEEDELKRETNLYDMKQYKYKGKFCNKSYSTCPVVPRFNATFGEPVEFQPMNVELERIGNVNHISEEGVKLMGRVDHIEIIEEKREVYIKDDFGIYILYECAMQDMKDLEEEMLKIGSYYISKHEYLVNTEVEKAYPLVDRITLLEDMLDKELDFQFLKVQLIQTYIEAYEHISDPLEQQRLIQCVVDIMAQRPRMNLGASYFLDSYDAEKLCLQKHIALMRTMITNQMTIEKQENKKIQAYIDLSLRMTQEHEKGKWKYMDPEEFFKELNKRKVSSMTGKEDHSQRGPSNLSVPGGSNTPNENQKNNDGKDQSMNGRRESQGIEGDLNTTNKFIKQQIEKNHASKYSKETHNNAMAALTNQGQKESQLSHKESEGGFAAVLGLPTITVETLYQQYKEKDEVIIELMNEHANYIKLYEGYPDFLIELQGLQSSKLANYKFSQWSFPINVLDFFESLSFAPKFYANLQSAITELEEVHKPHNSSLLAMIEFKILERAEIEYQKCKAFIDGDLEEYKGQQFLEEEAIVGNPDKITFHIKDMMANLNKGEKDKLNPFIIGKLDIDTIAHFDFASLPKELNPYQNPNVNLVQQEFETQIKIAEGNMKQGNAAQSRYFSQLKEYMRKINVPYMLNLYCNSVEMLRLRQELIAAISESMVLQEIYEAQGKAVNRPNFKPFFTDSVKFDNYLIDQQKVNFVDDGPAANIEFDLAIKEFDAVLKSSLNFRNPDSIKMLVNTSGLEELRGVLHYQLTHKQLLIIGVRLNQLIIDTHQRALSELELARRGYGLPNSIIKVQNLFCKTGDGFSNEQYIKEKAKYTNNLSGFAANVFYQLTAKKAKGRNNISKRFTNQLQLTAAQHRKTETCLRIMRAFKVKLLHAYCLEILRDAYHDTVKIQAIASCQKLRTMAQVFSIDESVVGVLNFPAGREQAQIFKYEDNEFIENFFSSYNPEVINEMQHKNHLGGPPQHAHTGAATNQLRAINTVKNEIVDYSIIPSTMTLMKLDSITQEEGHAMAEKYPSPLDLHKRIEVQPDIMDMKAFKEKQEQDQQIQDCEKEIQEILPTIEFCDFEYPLYGDKDRHSLRIHDFKQSYDYSNTQLGQIYSYYALLERIFKFEFSLSKINSSLNDALALEDAVYKGLPFWSIDPEQPLAKRRQSDSQHLASASGSKSGGIGQAPPQKLSERVIEKIVAEKRAKINLAEEVVNLSTTIFQIIEKVQNIYDTFHSGKTNVLYIPIHRINEFLITQMEFKYYHLIHVIERLLDTYYSKGATKEVKFLSDIHSTITKRDHVKISFKHNAFHVNGAYIRPDAYSLESQNFYPYYVNNEDFTGFQSCVQPAINEKALIPAQVTLLEGIYSVSLYKSSQYAGQIPHYPCVYPMLDTAFINLGEQERQYINSTLHSVKMLVKDFLEVIFKEKLAGETIEEGTIDQVKKGTKFLTDLIKARQLKVALMCWISCSTLPIDPQMYNQVMTQYKNDIFWKIMNKKDSLPPAGNVKGIEAEAPAQTKGGAQESALKKAEGSMVQNQQLMMMQAQVLVESVQTCKAEIIVLQNELHRNIINAAIQAIEAETAALANCFQLTANQIDSHIHPFQSFASTLYSKVDPNSHLDMVTKLSEVQRFITKLQNRGTEVETLTSGPGMVFTIKDFNECIQILCRGLIKYSEREMRARSENFAKKEAHYISMLYMKDRKIENLEQRIVNTQENLDKLINSKMYEKGNQLIYELDNVNRQLKLFKDNVFIMEKELVQNIRTEFKEFLRKQKKEMEHARQRFKDYKEHVTYQVSADITTEKDYITKEISKKAEDYKNKELGQPMDSRYSPSKKYNQRLMGPDKSSVAASKVFNTQALSGYMEEISNMTEIEARSELAEMWKEMRTLRMFWKTKEMITKDKYEREIFILKKQLTSNACLWEQLAEAEKREKVLKQELVFTQQSLAASEKVIDKLKDDLRKSESDRIRLSQYKTTKAQRLEELESKVRKFEVMENINLEKLIDALGKKERQITKLKDVEKNFNEKVEIVEKQKDAEINQIKTSYLKELGMKKEVLERLEGLRMELRLLEKNEGSMTEVWKSKCKELVDICNKLKSENDSLRQKITQIAMNLSSYGGITSGVDLEQQQSSYRQSIYDQGTSTQFTLPKLMNNTNSKAAGNIQANKFGVHSEHVTHAHTRQNSIQKQGLMGLQDSHMMSPQTIHEMSTSAHQSRSKDYSTNSKQIRGRSMYEGPLPNVANSKVATDQQSFAKSYNLFNTNTTTNKTSGQQMFGILGQQAQIGGMNTKGFQSMRVSQNNGNPKLADQAASQPFTTNRNSMNFGVENNTAGTGIGQNYSFKQGLGNEKRNPAGGSVRQVNAVDEEKPSTAYQRESIQENMSNPHLFQ